MQLTVDINTKGLTDATGMVALAGIDKPQFFYGTREILEFTFLNDGIPVKFSETDTFLCALDTNFIHTETQEEVTSLENPDAYIAAILRLVEDVIRNNRGSVTISFGGNCKCGD